MRRSKKISKENDLLNERVQYTGEVDNPTEIRVIRYSESDIQEKMLLQNEIPSVENSNQIIWIKVNGLKDVFWLKELTESIGLPSLGLQDILQPQIVARVENYVNLLQLNAKYHTFHENGLIVTEQISIILGSNFVITFQETDNDLFIDVLNALSENRANLRSRTSDYLFLILLNELMTQYINQMNDLEDSLETFEDKLLYSYMMNDLFRNQLKVQRSHYQILKQSILPLKESFYKIKDYETKLMHKKNSIYINAVYEQFKYLSRSLEICHDSFDVLINLYISNNDLRMNEIMKRLTIITAIFIPLTFLVGVWGMNFKYMPELQKPYGYLGAWGIMIVVAIGTWAIIRHRKWY